MFKIRKLRVEEYEDSQQSARLQFEARRRGSPSVVRGNSATRWEPMEWRYVCVGAVMYYNYKIRKDRPKKSVSLLFSSESTCKTSSITTIKMVIIARNTPRTSGRVCDPILGFSG